MKVKYLSISILISTLSSCLVLDSPNVKVEVLNKANFKQINGTYHSNIDTFTPNSLADLLVINYQVKYGKFLYNDNLKCSLKMINKSNLRVEIFRNNNLEFATSIKGKLKENFFYFEKQKYRGKRGYLFLRFPEKKKTRIAMLKNSNLVIDSKTRFGSRYFFIPMYHEDEEFNNVIFKQINKADDK